MANEIRIVRWQGGGDHERTRVSCGGRPDALLVHPWGDAEALHDAEVTEGDIRWHRGRLSALCVTQFGYGPHPCRCGTFEMVGLFKIDSAPYWAEERVSTWSG